MGVVRARRCVTAIPFPVGRYDRLIKPYYAEGELSHQSLLGGETGPGRSSPSRPDRRKSVVNERLSWRKSAEAASLRATKTRSQPLRTGVRRAASLTLRLTLFRTTAFPTLFPTEKPNRATSRPFRLAMSTKRLSDQLSPSRLAAAKSVALVRRWSLFISRRAREGGVLASDRKPGASLEHASLQDVTAVAGTHT